ncbi:MAG: hypothetical protein ACRDGM_02270 [bacterium]
MPRKPNESKTTDIHVTASYEVASYLKELAKIGVHGKTPSEVAKFLIGTEIERLLREGILKLRRSGKMQ